MKTSELTGAQLDYWVAKAEGTETSLRPFWDSWEMPGGDQYNPKEWAPSKFWEQGGPIIERERIGVDWFGGEWGAWWSANKDAAAGSMEAHEILETGATPLIAAMRAYVASKFGDEVAGPTAGESANG